MRLRRLALVAVSLMYLSCADPPVEHRIDGIDAEAALVAHSSEFERDVVQVTDGVWVAIGYGLANSIMIQGDGGRIIVDTMESAERAAQVKAAFDAIDPSPVAAIVYTHNHADHVFGAGAFAGYTAPPIYAHDTTAYYLDRVLNIVRPILARRSARMFGSHLDDAGRINAGIGPFLGIDADSTLVPLRPTVTFAERLEIRIAGVALELVHAPGETDDQIFVWLPEKRVLLCGDNLYKTFPNLYTIRGTPYRDVRAWVDSLDTMRYLAPEHLVPGHTRPISGADEVFRVLTDYRDGIQFVHDQTVRGMNRGLSPDELVEAVRLPAHLARSPYLQEFYGTVPWSVRAIFDGYLGWFDGNPTQLRPLPPADRARRIAELAGGPAALLDRAAAASEAGDHRWVLELTDHLLRLDPDGERARGLRVASLLALGEAESNPNARHYFLTEAVELRDGFTAGIEPTPTRETVHAIPLRAIFDNLAIKLDPEKSAEIDRKVAFVFPDTGETWTVHIRRGVAEVQPFPLHDPGLTVTVDSRIWKEIAAKLRSPTAALVTGKLQVEGGILELVRFLALFDR